jgi:hypothetical protein
MIEAHLRSRLKELGEEYGISRDRYKRETGQNVADMARHKQ